MNQYEKPAALVLETLALLLGAGATLGAETASASSGTEKLRGYDARCLNEGCSRPAESGERNCTTCGLERDLFRRDSRWTGPVTGRFAEPTRQPSHRHTSR
jgi:hypothetical protein